MRELVIVFFTGCCLGVGALIGVALLLSRPGNFAWSFLRCLDAGWCGLFSPEVRRNG